MRWRIGLGEDRGFGGSQVESVRAVASSPPTHPCYSLPFRATDPNWVWSSDWQAGQTITWTTDEANLFTRSELVTAARIRGQIRSETHNADRCAGAQLKNREVSFLTRIHGRMTPICI